MYHYTLTSYNPGGRQPRGMRADSSPRGPAASAWADCAALWSSPLRKSLTATSDERSGAAAGRSRGLVSALALDTMTLLKVLDAGILFLIASGDPASPRQARCVPARFPAPIAILSERRKVLLWPAHDLYPDWGRLSGKSRAAGGRGTEGALTTFSIGPCAASLPDLRSIPN